MSDPAISANLQAVSLTASNIGVGSYIVNDYLITVEESSDGNGYTMTIRKGSQTQTIHLTELTQETVDTAIESALADAKASGEFDGFSPVANVVKVGDIATITVTDENGTTTAEVTDGFSPSASVTKEDNTTVISVTDQNGSTSAEIVTPEVTVSKTGNTATITVTDENGTTTADISDGVTPVANVNKVDNAAIITITDDNGTTTAQILDGYTPMKGVDYWTAEELEEMASSAAALVTIPTPDWTAAEGTNRYISNKPAIASGSGSSSIEEGHSSTAASGNYSHAEGRGTNASGDISHAEGFSTKSTGTVSHSEGWLSEASGINSHAEGRGTIATNRSQHAAGEYNALDPVFATPTSKGKYVEIIGNGTGENARSNARTLDWDGNEVLAGKLTVGTAPSNDMDVATKKYVDDHSSEVSVISVNGQTGDVVLDIPDTTSDLVNDSGFITSSDLPTKTSDLQNDSGFLTSETDPVFTESPAAGITASNITSWNNKSDFSGSYIDLTNKPTIPTKVSDLQNDSGFLTSETDPVFTESPAAGITASNITSWNNKSDFSGSYNDLTDKPTIPTPVTVDDTLTTVDAAAEAKATGDALKDVVKIGEQATDFTSFVISGTEETVQLVEASDLTALDSSKVDISQGSANAGKVLTVGSDGDVVPNDAPVTDVQVDSTSVVSQGVANIPIADTTHFGVLKTNSDFGILSNVSGQAYINRAEDAQIKSGTHSYRPIVPREQHQSVFYGLAKAAGDTSQASSSNAVGTYTDDAKTAIHSMLGTADASAFGIVCNGTTATANITSGQYVIWNGALYVATANISSGTALSGNVVAVSNGGFNDLLEKYNELTEPYRLIKTITTADDIVDVYVTTDTDGNAFSLREVVIDFDLTAAASAGVGAIYPNMSSTSGSQDKAYLASNGLFATLSQRRVVRLRVEGGHFFGEGFDPEFSNHYGTVYMRTSRNASGIYECDKISSLLLRSLNGFAWGNGSTIKIYGR